MRGDLPLAVDQQAMGELGHSKLIDNGCCWSSPRPNSPKSGFILCISRVGGSQRYDQQPDDVRVVYAVAVCRWRSRRSSRFDQPQRFQNCSPCSLSANRKMLHFRIPRVESEVRQLSTNRRPHP